MKSVIDLANQVKGYTAAGKTIADVENGATAVGSYEIGEQFIRGGVLYKAKTAITAGDILTLNTNYELDDPVMEQLSSQKQALSDEVSARSFLGAHNLAKNYRGNDTLYGVSFVVNDDDSIHATAASSSIDGVEYTLTRRLDKNFYLPNGKYILSGSSDNSSSYIAVGCTKNNAWYILGTARTDEDIEFTVNGDDFSNDGAFLSLYIVVWANYGAVDETFHPMIRRADDADPNYSKPVLTNKELTEAIGRFKLLRIEGDAPSSTSAYEAKYISSYISAPAWFTILAAEKHNTGNNLWYEIATAPTGDEYVMKADADGSTSFRVKFNDITNYDKFRALVAYIPK